MLYTKTKQIGEGTYAKVYKAKCKKSNKNFALKKIKKVPGKNGIPSSAIREIKLLQILKNKYVVELVETVVEKDLYLVLEYMKYDLSGILLKHSPLSKNAAKHLSYILLKGFSYLHEKEIVHRDIKGANILVSSSGEIKISDFGLSRFFVKDSMFLGVESERNCMNMTNRVVSLWYRAPELLIGKTEYGPEIDVWSLGCLFFEIFTGKTLFRGKTEEEQTILIESLLLYKEKKKIICFFLKNEIPLEMVELIMEMLQFNPKNRISTTEALLHKCFKVEKEKNLKAWEDIFNLKNNTQG